MSYKFVNPYNFIPLSALKPKACIRSSDGLYSGIINYTLYTKSPLFIPNTSNDDAFKCGIKGHKSYDFFSYTDISEENESVEKKKFLPVIAGSEIRGLIRSNYEILTNSCMTFLDSDTVMQKRTHEVFKAGLLKKSDNDTFDLYEAEDCLLRTKKSNCIEDVINNPDIMVKSYIQETLREGQRVEFEYIKRPIKNREGKLPDELGWEKFPAFAKPLAHNINCAKQNINIGYVIKGESDNDINKKHCCHIFSQSGDKPLHRNINIFLLEQVLKAYEETYKEYKECFEIFKNSEKDVFFPVYYSVIFFDKSETGKIVFLAPAAITREAYGRKLSDLVGEYAACKNKESLCPACKLFGTIKTGEGAFAVASDIRFSDMTFVGDIDTCYYEKTVTLEPLSSPRLNNMEFYLQRPSEDAIFWTYDYYIDLKGNIKKNTAGINGRKFYWHDLNRELKSYEKNKLNITVRPLKSGQKFKGQVYFKSITKEELDTLIFTINVGDENTAISEKLHGYKIGHAKPLGFGSVALNVDSVNIKKYIKDTIKKEICLKIVPYDGYERPNVDKKIIENFSKMTSFETIGTCHTDYPRIEENGDIFAWFTENHKGYDRFKKEYVGMPNKRIQEYFVEYMIPMKPELNSTGASESFAEKREGKSLKREAVTSIKKKCDEAEKWTQKSQSKYEIGKEYIATVYGFNPKKTTAKIKIDGKNCGGLFFKEIDGALYGKIDTFLPEKTEIRVRYLGKKDNYEQWKFVGKK